MFPCYCLDPEHLHPKNTDKINKIQFSNYKINKKSCCKVLEYNQGIAINTQHMIIRNKRDQDDDGALSNEINISTSFICFHYILHYLPVFFFIEPSTQSYSQAPNKMIE